MSGYQIFPKTDPFEARTRVPLSEMPTFEAQGFVPDGAAFSEDGETKIDLHRSSVFDGCTALGFPGGGNAVLAKSVVELEAVTKATLYVTALGYYEPFCNGVPLTDAHYIPALSDYYKRDLRSISYPIRDRMSHRIYYHVFDLGQLLHDGENVLAFHIGKGWLDNRNRAEGMPSWGDLTLLFRLDVQTADGKTVRVCSTPENTFWRTSHITDTSLYFGEAHDYGLFDSGWTVKTKLSGWSHAAEKSLPPTFFMPTDFPGDREDGEILPELIWEDGNDRIYDLHTIPAGFPLIRPTAAGSVTVTYGDKLIFDEDGAPDFVLRHTGGEWRAQKDTFFFTKNEIGKLYHVHFTWHASRYLRVSGRAMVPAFIRVNSPLEQRIEKKTGETVPDWIFNAFVDTVRANLHGFIPSDCPHRERLGYTGDGQLTSRAVMRVFDARVMYRKWLRDILDCQDITGGHVQHTAPFYGGGGGPGGWGGAICIVPWNFYEIYGDDSLLQQAYHGMKAYIGYMLRHCENGIVTHEEPQGWCLGDWCPPEDKILLPEPFVNTYFLIHCLGICEKTALLFGKDADADEFTTWKKDAETAFINAFWDPATGSFCGGEQGADAFAIELGLGDERTKRNLLDKYGKLRTFDTGIFGTDVLLRVLIRLHEKQLAKDILCSQTPTSFYNMMLGGTNTLWENWDGCDSMCHPMFGAVVDSLLELYP